MKRLALALAALALTSSAVYRAPEPRIDRPRERLTIYEAATLGTIVPAALLRAVAIVESSERDDAIGPDGLDLGRYQLREVYHAERAARWGEYDPHGREAGHVAARILEEAFRALGDWDLAIAAYRQGVAGVRRDGAAEWYVERVRRQM